jgi:hypothetical protein
MRVIATAVAIAVGIIVLLDVFITLPLLDQLGTTFREWTIILTAFALLLGLYNLLLVHLSRLVKRHEPGFGYSAVVLVTFVIVLSAGLWFGLPSPQMEWLFSYLYLPLQGTFFALMAFFLATAAYRSLRAKSLETLLMLAAALVVFLGQMPLSDSLAGVRQWVLNVPSTAGVSGILLGVGLGAMATGLRLIVGLDRPYSE